MRGEHVGFRELVLSKSGSSPHAWGTLKDLLCINGFLFREAKQGLRKFNIGSSPHAWGTRKIGLPLDSELRFIPTLGNTQICHLFNARNAVHPHMRGEHPWRDRSTDNINPAVHPHMRGEHYLDARNQTCSKARGSSPHAWGTRTPDTL